LGRIARELGIHRETVSTYVAEAGAKPANPTAGTSGPKSRWEPFREVVPEKLESGLSAERIWQDLHFDHGFTGNYGPVKRSGRRGCPGSPTPRCTAQGCA